MEYPAKSSDNSSTEGGTPESQIVTSLRGDAVDQDRQIDLDMYIHIFNMETANAESLSGI